MIANYFTRSVRTVGNYNATLPTRLEINQIRSCGHYSYHLKPGRLVCGESIGIELHSGGYDYRRIFNALLKLCLRGIAMGREWDMKGWVGDVELLEADDMMLHDKCAKK